MKHGKSITLVARMINLPCVSATTHLLRCLGEQQSPRDRCSDRRPFVRTTSLQMGLTDKRRTKKLENRPVQTASRWPLRYEGIQCVELRAVLWLNHSHTPQRSCARASGEEELQELQEEKDETRKMSLTFSTHWRVFVWKNWLKIFIFCIVCTFASTVLCAQFSLYTTLAAVFHCITVYKHPPPPIHRQHYHAFWYYITLLISSYLQ